jgi:dolichyl-phosphate-mannose-protein mannosyltransferase
MNTDLKEHKRPPDFGNNSENSFFMIFGLILLVFYFLMARDLKFFMPRDFIYIMGPRSLVPITDDLGRSSIRYFAPWLLSSMFWKFFLLLPSAFLLSIFFAGKIDKKTIQKLYNSYKSMHPVIAPAILCLTSLLVILCLNTFVFQKTYITDDENAYVLQAKIIEGGHIFAPSPPVPQNFNNWFILTDGIFTGKYTLGFPVILAIGHIISGSYYFLPICLSILTVLLFYLSGKELFDRNTGLLAAFFLSVSPFFLFNSSTLLSHSTTLFFVSLFFLFYFKGLKKFPFLFGIICGLAIGMTLNIRPLTAVGFGFPFGIYLTERVIRRKIRGKSLLFPVACILGFSIIVAFTFWYNKKVSGSIFKFPFNVYDPLERLGFGAMLDRLRYTHTPFKGIQNLLVSIGRFNLWYLGIPISLFLMLPLFFSGKMNKWDTWCLVVIGSFCAAYILYYSPGVPETGPVYYFELLLPVSLLSARGVIILHEIIKAEWKNKASFSIVPVFVIISIFFSLLSFFPEKSLHIAAMTDRLKEPYDLVEKNAELPALIFVKSLPRVGWVFGYRNTDPYLKAPLIYCTSSTPENNIEVLKYFPDRNYYVLWYDAKEGKSRLKIVKNEK